MKIMRFTALLAASCMMLTAAPPLIQPAAEICAAGEAEAASALPDWVPADTESAKAFLKALAASGSSAATEGARTGNGIVCLVYEEQAQWASGEPLYSFSYTPEMFETVSDTLTEAKQGYVYHIVVLKPLKAGTADVYNIQKNAQKTPVPFRFRIDGDLNITEVRLPKWLPADFDSAVTFYNRYGKTRIFDGLLCTVFSEYMPPESSLLPEQEYLFSYSEEQLDNTFSQYFTNDEGWYFRVDLFQPVKAGDASVVHDEIRQNFDPYEYTFQIDDALKITETDPCAWVPDCSEEFYGHLNNKQTVLVHGDQVAFLLETTAGTGYSWQEAARTEEAVSQIADFDCTRLRFYQGGAAPTGGAVAETRVYQVRKDGPFDLRLDLLPPGQGAEAAETLGGTFYAVDQCSMIMQPGEARVSMIDADTGRPVVYPNTENQGFYLDYLIGEYENGPEHFNLPQFCKISSNPGKAELGSIFQEEQYKLWLNTAPQGYSCDAVYENGTCDTGDEITVSMLTDSIADITVKVHFAAEGDVNSDGSFDAADTVLLAQWLTGTPDTVLKNWKAADFCNDDALDARDLTAMKQAMLSRREAESENNLILTVKTIYGGFGVTGQPLDSGEFETEFPVLEGDCFYEVSNGHWYQNVRVSTPILTIKKIEGSKITVSAQNGENGEEAVLELGEWKEGFPRSRYVVYDGINYSYSICFTAKNTMTPAQPDSPA
ncbi:MAG: dockerin type I repeat-containing protein [Oscillospiraceae bacterium]|nr:dockerin type I repeat-containing protein [Oscillospiraceae bacterium]